MKKNTSKTLLYAAALALGAFLLMGSSKGDITGTEAHALVKAGAVLLDVRTPEEFSAGHVQGATNIPLDELAQRLDALKEKKNTDVVVYCHSGRRSALAVKALKEAGFSKVHDLGPMSAW